MRLLSITLSGFKSFVDHTVTEISRQLIGVVGPNGCGKSNIIDAVRWVLGESRASVLRGEGMQSVIFSGSQRRHAVSRASVELLFDNHASMACNEWSQYAEICVKRVVTKQEGSLYFINNQAVRRREVADLFSGTSPLAYAIVEQGTVARILEAHPDDIRRLLEDAAGVSRYRDKKREAENRLNDAQDNMRRVEDVTQQLAEQENHLAQQALRAQQYVQWTSSLHDLQIRVLVVKYQRIYVALQKDQDTLSNLQQAMREKKEQCAACTARAIQGREEKDGLHTVLCDQQKHVYQLREALLKHQERYRHQSAMKVHWLHQWQTVCEQVVSTQQVIALLSARALDAQTACVAEEEQWQHHVADLACMAKNSVLLQEQLAQATLCLAEARAVFLQQEKDHHAAVVQYDRLCAELVRTQTSFAQHVHEASFLVMPDEHALQTCVDQLHQSQSHWTTAIAHQQEVTACWAVCRRTVEEKQQYAQELSTILAHIDGQISTLEHSYPVAAGEGNVPRWLATHPLRHGYQRLWSWLQVDPRWATAVEAILREHLHAIVVEDLTMGTAFFTQRPPASVMLCERKNHGGHLAQWSHIVTVQDAALACVVSDWLSAYEPVSTWQEALEKRATLACGHFFILPNGDTVSRSGIVLLNPQVTQVGFVAWQKKMAALSQERADHQQAWQVVHDAVQRLCADLAVYEQEKVVSHCRVQECVEHIHAFEKQHLSLEQERVHFQDRLQRHQKNGADLAQRLQALGDEQVDAQKKCADLVRSMASQGQDVKDQQQHHETLTLLCEDRMAALHAAEKKEQEYQFSVHAKKMHVQDVTKEEVFYQKNRAQLLDTQRMVEKELASLEDRDKIACEIAQKEEQLACSEKAWQASAAQLAECQRCQQQIEQEQAQHAQEYLVLQEREQSLLLRMQECQLGLSHIEEHCVSSLDTDPSVLRRSTETHTLHTLHDAIQDIQQNITALGAVNLVAVEELAQIRERRAYLLAQLDDLRAAIDTIECAIAKIDDNTRQVLRSVLQQVNEHVLRFFTVLFDGGEARLEIMGTDLLNAGLRIVAKPPGKKNHSIHMLSGGEKALTALALLFAMVALSPAPFCMLDEVDAPLDDVNATRLSRLMQEVSIRTQMLFVTHNKITMEIAQQLVGVTMQELGVSRIVRVDMDHIDQMIRDQSIQSVAKSEC